MIIKLSESKLFTVEPAKRFAKKFNVDEKVWRVCWIKYKLLHLTPYEFIDYIHFKAGIKLSYDSVLRWIFRTEVYSRAQDAFKMEATTVVSSFFGEREEQVIQEISRNMRAGLTQNSRSIV